MINVTLCVFYHNKKIRNKKIYWYDISEIIFQEVLMYNASIFVSLDPGVNYLEQS